MKKKVYIALGIILLILIITNPNPEDFKTFIIGKYELTKGRYNWENEFGEVSYGRTQNFIFLSIYTYSYHVGYERAIHSEKHIGILKNFF